MRSTKPVLDPRKIKHAMIDRDMNQAKLAKAVNVDPSRVSLWLSGNSNPDLPSAASMARALGVTIDSLLCAH